MRVPFNDVANGVHIMATIEKLLAQAKAARASALHAQKRIYENAELAGRKTLTTAENAELAKLREAADKAKATIEQLRSIQAEEADAMADASTPDPNGRTAKLPAGTASFQVGRNERTYRPDTDPFGTGFARDVGRAFAFGDREAAMRLDRHTLESAEDYGKEYRAAGDFVTSNGAGLVVPQYLVDLAAPAVAKRRPFADAMRRMPLPAEGMKVEISRITTATSAALQANELDAVSATTMDDTLLELPVQTAAGQQVVSRQALERGRVENLIVQDLQVRYATVLDDTVLNQATTGALAVAQAVTYDDASPTGAELYPKLLEASSDVEAALLGASADVVAMHSRRWHWLSKEMSSTWPLINSQGIPVQAGGVNLNRDYGAGFRGRLPNGMAVVVDNNLPVNLGTGTNQDVILVVPTEECILFEMPGAPVFIRAEQPKAGNLGVLLVVYGYFAYTFSRYTNALAKVDGTALVTPVF